MERSSRNAATSRDSRSPQTIDLSDDETSPPDEELEILYEAFAPFNVDSEDEGEDIVVHDHLPAPSSRSSPKPPPRTASTAYEVASCEWAGVILKPGMTVELYPGTFGNPTEKWGDFLTITKVRRIPATKKADSEIVLEGLQTRRGKRVPMFNNKLNEVSLLLDICTDDPRDCFEQGTIRVFLEDVKQVREMVYTSIVYPEHSYLTVACPNISRRRKQDQLHLTCRWVFITTYPDLKSKRSKAKAFQGEVRRFDAHEIVLNGRSVSKPATYARDQRPRFTFQEATYFDGFCGAGGAAEGAKQGGATVVAGVDDNESALLTFAMNHTAAAHLLKDMTVAKFREFMHVLILHLSPPCQYFSPAHTHEGKDDDKNSACLLCVGAKLQEIQPIYLTLENTSGLPSHHPEWFAQLINQIISEGYNVRWLNNCQMMSYGLPTSRKRLILFAAKDGYPLPDFPKPIHGDGLQPYTTVGQAIAHISNNDPLHLSTTKRLDPAQAPYSSEAQLNCITTAGDIPHPSGTRTFSLRELSMLVGFPSDYEFVGKNEGEIRRQIGNVVPPMVWKHFIQAIIKSHRDFEARINSQADDDIIEVINGPTSVSARGSTSRSSGSSSASTPQHRQRMRSRSPSSRPSSSRSRGSRRERVDDTAIPIRRMGNLTVNDRSPRRYAVGRSRDGDSEMIDLDD